MTDKNVSKKKLRKRASDLTKEEDQDTEDPAELVSPIIMGAVCAGVVVLLCRNTGQACLWYVASFLLFRS